MTDRAKGRMSQKDNIPEDLEALRALRDLLFVLLGTQVTVNYYCDCDCCVDCAPNGIYLPPRYRNRRKQEKRWIPPAVLPTARARSRLRFSRARFAEHYR